MKTLKTKIEIAAYTYTLASEIMSFEVPAD